MKKFGTKALVYNALIASGYAALSMFLPMLSYGVMQLRFGEALTILPALLPYSYVGLTIGCFVANTISPFGIADMLIGSCVTLLAGILTSRIRKPLLAALPPILLNAAILPIVWYFAGGDSAYLTNALSLLVSQSLVIYVLGMPLYYIGKKYLFPENLTK